MRVSRLTLIGLLLAIVVPACHKGSDETARRRKTQGPVRIGFSFDSLQLERWQHDGDAFVARAKELGAEVSVQSADGQDSVQVRQCVAHGEPR